MSHSLIVLTAVTLADVIDRRTEMLVFCPQLGPMIKLLLLLLLGFFSSSLLCYWHDIWLNVLYQLIWKSGNC